MKQVLIIEGVLHGGEEQFRHCITLHKPQSGGMNPLTTEITVMAYGCRQDLAVSAPEWIEYPLCNVKCWRRTDANRHSEL
jgi:hypothetical protein